jgi:hypothetical protein
MPRLIRPSQKLMRDPVTTPSTSRRAVASISWFAIVRGQQVTDTAGPSKDRFGVETDATVRACERTNRPPPWLRMTTRLSVGAEVVIARSGRPSPLKSVVRIRPGEDSWDRSLLGKVQSPRLVRRTMVESSMLATTRSMRPWPVKSAAVTAAARAPVR